MSARSEYRVKYTYHNSDDTWSTIQFACSSQQAVGQTRIENPGCFVLRVMQVVDDWD